MVYIPIVIFYTIFGIGASIRYVYFLSIGKKKKYDDLIAPNIQSVWNFLLSLIVVGIFLFLLYKNDIRTSDKKYPPIEVLMNKKY
jgi:hypothetical protein